MRKPDVVMLMVSCLFSVAALAAAADNPQPPLEIKAVENALKPVADNPRTPLLKAIERKRNVAPRTSHASSKPLLPQLDEKSLGLGCAQP